MLFRTMCVGACALALSVTANAAVFTGSSGPLSASVEFSVSGNNLHVRLTNTSAMDVTVPSQVLTAVFFSVTGPSLTLTPIDAVLSPGSVVNGNSSLTDPGGVVGGEWAYKAGPHTTVGGRGYGISSTGIDIFGPFDMFPGNNLQGPAGPDGLQYGITSAGDNPATGNGGIMANALIQNSVDFRLSGLPAGFDVGRVTDVYFLYGTSIGEGGFPGVPAPSALALLGLGMILTGRRRR